MVEISTVNMKEPTADPVDAPEGLWGGTITNAIKVPGRIRMWMPDGSLAFDSGDYSSDSGMTIKIRGNWSGRRPKCGYKIKLQQKSDLLCRNSDEGYKDKDWLLLSEEIVSLNTPVGRMINKLAGLPWTPAYRQVNVIFNQDYRGVYMLSESVKRNPVGRLNVDKASGYIVELDAYWWNEPVYLKSNLYQQKQQYTLKYPEDDKVTQEQLKLLQAMLNSMETSVKADNYTDWIDCESLARWLIAHDLLGTSDFAGSNIFLLKYDSSPFTKFQMGNLWDFDTVFRTRDEWATAHYTMHFYPYYLFGSSNPAFAETYCRVWEECGNHIVDSVIDWLRDYVDTEEAVALNRSRVASHLRWGNSEKTRNGILSVEADVADAIEWFTSRKTWMDNAVNNIRHQTGDITQSVGRNGADNSENSYYDLYGRRFETEPASGLYIHDGMIYLRR